MRNADMPAMPLVDPDKSIATISNQEHEFIKQCNGAIGLTKREEFAKAMAQGLLAGGYCIDDPQHRLVDVPNEAISLADALLKALEES